MEGNTEEECIEEATTVTKTTVTKTTVTKKDKKDKKDNLDWYRPIDPTIYSFLKDYYHSNKRNRIRN